MNVLGYLGRQSKAALTALGVGLVAVTGILQYLTAPNLSFLVYYLVPVALAAWFVGKWPSILIAAVSAAVSAVAGVAATLRGDPGPSTFTVPYSIVSAQFGFFLITLAYVLTALKVAFDRADRLARTDYLTGVANHRAFAEMANAELERARRYEHPFSLCYIDVDNFKTVNDRLGHGVGDGLLRVVADTVRRQIRTSDAIARLGGDEFAILLPETAYEAAQVVVGKVHESLSEMARLRGWPVTFSMGVVTCLESPDSVEMLIKAADRLMYTVKRGGKGRIRHEILGKSPTPA
ncbi:MAG TPA: GGDEF domain-containing protein [Methylomirabilota bacterium]|jgi:diguanylate cyclase (GGDEF)-like protein|nr:GGDEF domain-containing protein [Methylomirabilota bacterium]